MTNFAPYCQWHAWVETYKFKVFAKLTLDRLSQERTNSTHHIWQENKLHNSEHDSSVSAPHPWISSLQFDWRWSSSRLKWLVAEFVLVRFHLDYCHWLGTNHQSLHLHHQKLLYCSWRSHQAKSSIHLPYEYLLEVISIHFMFIRKNILER